MSAPKVSIGMPVYNGEPFICDAIDSIQSQTFKDFELIISDNCSTDNTQKICKEYSDRDFRITYVRQRQNIGPTRNFEFVLEKASGEYFLWMAADDKLHPLFIEKLYKLIVDHSDIVLVMSDVLNISHDNEILFSQKLDNIRIEDVNKDWLRTRKFFFENPTSNIFFCVYGLFRTEFVKLASLNYKSKIKYLRGSEIPFLAQVSLLGKIASIPEELKIYRRHPNSSFHLEDKKLTTFQHLDSLIRISWCLILIVVEAEIPTYEKASLIYTVISTLFKWLCISVAKKIYCLK